MHVEDLKNEIRALEAEFAEKLNTLAMSYGVSIDEVYIEKAHTWGMGKSRPRNMISVLRIKVDL